MLKLKQQTRTLNGGQTKQNFVYLNAWLQILIKIFKPFMVSLISTLKFIRKSLFWNLLLIKAAERSILKRKSLSYVLLYSNQGFFKLFKTIIVQGYFNMRNLNTKIL